MQMIGEIKEDTSAQSQQPPKADREKVQSDVTEEQEERLQDMYAVFPKSGSG